MSRGLGNAIVVSMLALLFLITILYITTPNPKGSPMMSMVINGSIGVILLLGIVLFGIVMGGAGSDPN